MSKVCRWKCITGRHIVSVIGKSEPDTYEPGDIIECTRAKLGNAIDKFEMLEEVNGDPDVIKRVKRDTPRKPTAKADKYRVKHLGSGRYDVISLKSGKKINTEPMTRKEVSEYMDDSKSSTLIAEKEVV